MTRSGSGAASTVYVSTSTGSAGATDYQPLAKYVVDFSAYETSKTVTLLANGDTKFEPNESFAVNLTTPVNATIADAQGIGTITNDDARPPARVFVATGGADGNDCSLQATPCRNLNAAIAQVAAGHVLPFTTEERRRVDGEEHAHGGLVHLEACLLYNLTLPTSDLV